MDLRCQIRLHAYHSALNRRGFADEICDHCFFWYVTPTLVINWPVFYSKRYMIRIHLFYQIVRALDAGNASSNSLMVTYIKIGLQYATNNKAAASLSEALVNDSTVNIRHLQIMCFCWHARRIQYTQGATIKGELKNRPNIDGEVGSFWDLVKASKAFLTILYAFERFVIALELPERLPSWFETRVGIAHLRW